MTRRSDQPDSPLNSDPASERRGITARRVTARRRGIATADRERRTGNERRAQARRHRVTSVHADHEDVSRSLANGGGVCWSAESSGKGHIAWGGNVSGENKERDTERGSDGPPENWVQRR